MPNTNFSIKYRPVKIGFLVQDGNIDNLVTIAKLNTLLWGGIHNLIIPVKDGGDEAIKLIERLPLDVLHPIVETEGIRNILNKFPFLKSPRHFAYELFVEDWHSKKKEIVYLDSLNIIERYYEKHFKGSSPKAKSNCALARWSSEDSLASLFAISFGCYAKELNLKENFEDAFVRGLRAHEIEILKDTPLTKNLTSKITPLVLTSLDLKDYSRDLFRGDGIYAGESANFDDLVTFWNLRAMGVMAEFFPISHAGRFNEYTKSHLNRLANIIDKNPNTHRYLCLYHRGLEKEKIESILNGISVRARVSSCDLGKTLLLGSTNELPTDYLSWDFSMGTIENSDNRSIVTVIFPEKKFIPNSDRDIKRQVLVASIDAMSEFGYEEHTINPPNLRNLNEFYSREMAIDPWKVRAERDGIGLIIDVDEKYENLYPLKYLDLIKKLFASAEIEAKVSQPGLLAHEIIHAMRERDPIEACRIFKIRGIRKLLKKKRAGDCVRWEQAMEIIGKEQFDKFKTLFIESRDTKELTPQDAFNFLIKKNIFKPKLNFLSSCLRRKKDYKCRKCGLGSRINYSFFEGWWLCEYCNHKQFLPSLIREEFKKKDFWYFKKGGLFAKDNNQEGAIPVILTLLIFKRIFNTHKYLYSTSLNLKFDSGSAEIDFSLLQYEQGDRMQLAIGECKSDDGEVTQQDIENLKKVREKFKRLGINCFLVFAKTNDGFSDQEIALFKNLKSEQIPVILFTNKELEPYDPYWHDEDTEKLPHKYALTMSELARNSAFRYLDQKKN